METRQVVTSDGWSLGVRVLPAHGPSRGVAVLLHAMMADGRSLLRGPGDGLAGAVARAGVEVWVPDFRGHGLSGPTPADGATWTYDDLVHRDVPALVQAARAHGRVVVGGQSLGGHVSAASAAGGHIAPDGLLLLAANIWRPSLEPDRRLRLRKLATLTAFAGAARLGGHLRARQLRLGPADEARPYCDDLLRFWTSDAWTSRDGTEDWSRGLATVEAPVLHVHGAGDRLYASHAGAHAWAAPLRRRTSWVVGHGSLGVAHAPGHMEVVTDPRCAPAHRAVAAWVAATLA